MSRIVEIENSHSIDFSGRELEFFTEVNISSKLQSYEFLYNSIMNAEVIKIASTSDISEDILDMLNQNSGINTYIVLKDFSNSSTTLQRFNGQKPSVIREVKELENSFIVIDNSSYIFLNPLNEKDNIPVLTSKETKDLDFIFNYYFWNCSSMEKLVDKIDTPIESPFPPFGIRELESINISNLESFQRIYIPKDKKFISNLDLEAEDRYFSDDLKVPLFINEDNFQIGRFIINQDLEIINSWKLHKAIQKNIDLNLEFIPKSENWDRVVKIQNFKNVTLETMRSETIESMENTKPNLYPEESFINHINYSWKVLPPVKPKNAQQSSLYSQFNEIKKKFDKNLDKLETHLDFIIKESGVLSRWFSGINRKAQKNLKKIEEYREKDLHSMSIIDLNNFLNSEFKDFYQSIIKDENDFKEDKKRKEAEDRWNIEKEKREKELAKNRETLSEKESELNELKKLIDQKRELSKRISEVKSYIMEKESSLKTEKKNLELSEKEENSLKELQLQIKRERGKVDEQKKKIKEEQQAE